MAKPQPKLPPPTAEARERAALAAEAIRAAIADPAEAGAPSVAHIYYGGGRSAWLRSWANLPGLTQHVAGAVSYAHELLPGWQYSVREFRTEMLDDLDRLARDGVRPAEATR